MVHTWFIKKKELKLSLNTLSRPHPELPSPPTRVRMPPRLITPHKVNFLPTLATPLQVNHCPTPTTPAQVSHDTKTVTFPQDISALTPATPAGLSPHFYPPVGKLVIHICQSPQVASVSHLPQSFRALLNIKSGSRRWLENVNTSLALGRSRAFLFFVCLA